MSTSGAVITLPGRAEMLSRLLGVNKSTYFQQNLYPKLLKSAGYTVTPQTLVDQLSLAFGEVMKGLPAAMHAMFAMEVPFLIEALVDEPEAAAQAKEYAARSFH